MPRILEGRDHHLLRTPPPGTSGKSRTPLHSSLLGKRRFGHFRPWSSASSALAGRKWPPAGRGSGGFGAAWEARSRQPERLVRSGVLGRRRRWLVSDWKLVRVRVAWEPVDPGRAGRAGGKDPAASSARPWRAGATVAVPGSVVAAQPSRPAPRRGPRSAGAGH